MVVRELLTNILILEMMSLRLRRVKGLGLIFLISNVIQLKVSENFYYESICVKPTFNNNVNLFYSVIRT